MVQYFPPGFIEFVVLAFIGAYVWAVVANTVVFVFLGFVRRVFGVLGERIYLVFLALLLMSSFTVVYGVRGLLLSHKMTPPSVLMYVGLGFLAVGFALSLWSSSVVGWKSLFNIPSVLESGGGRKLVCSGPYSLGRNPLYVGDLTVLFGVFMLTGYLSLLLLFMLYAVHISVQARMEEKELAGVFAEEFGEYAACVPRFIIRKRRIPGSLLP